MLPLAYNYKSICFIQSVQMFQITFTLYLEGKQYLNIGMFQLYVNNKL